MHHAVQIPYVCNTVLVDVINRKRLTYCIVQIKGQRKQCICYIVHVRNGCPGSSMITVPTGCVHCETPSSVVAITQYKRASCVQLQFSNLSSKMRVEINHKRQGTQYTDAWP